MRIFKHVGKHIIQLEIGNGKTVLRAVLFTGQHIGEFQAIPHQVAKLANIRRWNKAGLDHTAHIQVTDPLGILAVCFVAFLRFDVFGVCQSDPTGLFENIEYRNPILACRFHTDIGTGVFRKPFSQTL